MIFLKNSDAKDHLMKGLIKETLKGFDSFKIPCWLEARLAEMQGETFKCLFHTFHITLRAQQFSGRSLKRYGWQNSHFEACLIFRVQGVTGVTSQWGGAH